MDAALDEITMPTEIVAAIGEGALAYRESGILSLADGRVFSACRQYRYRLSEDCPASAPMRQIEGAAFRRVLVSS